MKNKSSWLPRVSATAGLLLLIASGCAKDFDALSASWGKGGSGGKGQGGSGGGGTAAGGSPGAAGAEEAGMAGEGEGGRPDEPSGGKGGTEPGGGAGPAGGGGASGGIGGSCTMCGSSSECVDLIVGTPDGENGVTNCGACDMTCSLSNADSATCKAGACTPKCKTNYGDCSGANDGCETDLTKPAHCGTCSNTCSLVGVATAACTEGRCTPTCTSLYADCNGSTLLPALNDGCEVYLDALDHCTTGCNATSVACEATKVCNAGSCVAPNGLVVLSTPLTIETTSATRYADIFPTNMVDLEGTSITVRVYAPGATGGTFAVFMSDNSSGFGPEVSVDLATISQKWTDIALPCTSSGAFNAHIVKQINLRIQGGPPAVTSPTTVYVDSVRTSNLVINDTFDASFGNFSKSSLVALPGSTLSWTAAIP